MFLLVSQQQNLPKELPPCPVSMFQFSLCYYNTITKFESFVRTEKFIPHCSESLEVPRQDASRFVRLLGGQGDRR